MQSGGGEPVTAEAPAEQLKRFGEIEAILAAAQSKSPSLKYKPDLSPTQDKVVQDYPSSHDSSNAAQSARMLTAYSGTSKPKSASIDRTDELRDAREFADIVSGMPRFDAGSVEIEVRDSRLAAIFGRRYAAWRIERQVRRQAASQVPETVRIYARILQACARKAFSELQGHFDQYAETYRARLNQLGVSSAEGREDETAVRADLEALAAALPEDTVRGDA